MPSRRATLALPFLALTASAQSAASWRIVTEYPANAIPGEGVAHFAAAATRLAAGALTVEPGFDAPDGLRSADMAAAVADGRLPAADAFAGALAGTDPLFLLSSLPFLTAGEADTRRLLEAARPAYEAALTERGLTLLYATPWPPTGLWSRAALGAEFAGLRVRTYDVTGTAVLRAAGAAPRQVSFADAMPLLRGGALDAVLSSGDGGAGQRLWELLPHFTRLDYAWPLSLAFCSAAALAALPEPGRAAVLAAAQETEARQWTAIRTRLAENEARMAANGVAVADPPPALRARLAEAGREAVTAWEARVGARGAAILAAYRRAAT